MTPAPVGLRCPEHAGKPRRAAKALGGRHVVRAPQTRFGGTQALVTKTLIALNVGIYLIGGGPGSRAEQSGCRLY